MLPATEAICPEYSQRKSRLSRSGATSMAICPIRMLLRTLPGQRSSGGLPNGDHQHQPSGPAAQSRSARIGVVPTILLLSTADTELLAARASGADYRVANPARTSPDAVPGLARGADLAVLRLLGGREAWPGGIEALRATGLPLIILGGEAAPDAGLMAQSTVAAGTVTEALAYLREGGPANLRELAAFLSDTVLLTGEGFAPPAAMPQHGVHPLPAGPAPAPEGPTVAVVYYRAHELSGNTAFVD